MAEKGPKSEDSTQSFVVRTWQEPHGGLRGSIRHVQSKAQRGFTQLSQAQEFIEQNLEQTDIPTTSVSKPATHHWPNWAGLHRRRMIIAIGTAGIVMVAGLVIIAGIGLPDQMVLLGNAADRNAASGTEVILALIIGMVVGSLGTAAWFRRHR